MKDKNEKPIHPGTIILENFVKPRKLSVTKAALMLGISRPQLSNFLNGKVRTSPAMATKLEKTFGVSARNLLDLQTSYDMSNEALKNSTSRTRSYVPRFLEVQANEITTWGETIPARTRLAVLIRTLVHSTGQDIKKIDFPGNNYGERPGSDGYLETNYGTPWIPRGRSIWELGTNKNIKKKADDDFNKSVSAFSSKNPKDLTYIFVTTRKWPGKDVWVEEKQRLSIWKEVRAYDANDLEQWIEQSPPAQVWFAKETGRPSENVRTLERCWFEWSEATSPTMHSSLFSCPKEAYKETIRKFLTSPKQLPLTIASDSVEEALAFLHQSLDCDEFQNIADKTLVFDKVGTIPKLAEGNISFIAVTYRQDVGRELAPYSSVKHICILPRNTPEADPAIILYPLSAEDFKKSLVEMGVEEDKTEKLSNSSGRSLTTLRRQLANNPSIRTPHWATNVIATSPIIPLSLIGIWCPENEDDKKLLERFSNCHYKELEKKIREYELLNESPIWTIRDYQGIVSQFDSLSNVSAYITKTMLQEFFQIAYEVLSEGDSSLDYSYYERDASRVDSKEKRYSDGLRQGIAESLVLISVYTKKFFKHIRHIDIEAEIENVVSKILLPLTPNKLKNQENFLKFYAEACPSGFLKIIGENIKKEGSSVYECLKTADSSSLFSRNYRAGILRALECLAWSPETFLKTVDILAYLSINERTDFLRNMAINSLCSILRLWRPQTVADHDQRITALKHIVKKFPEISWDLFCHLVNPSHTEIITYNKKPLWRTYDCYVVPSPNLLSFAEDSRTLLISLALSQTTYNSQQLCDLISRFPNWNHVHRNRVWALLDEWVNNKPNQGELYLVREAVRTRFFSDFALKHFSDSPNYVALQKKALSFLKKSEPTDLIYKHLWLFDKGYVNPFIEAGEVAKRDYQAKKKKLLQLRSDAISEIVEAHGFSGILEFIKAGAKQSLTGYAVLNKAIKPEQRDNFFIYFLQNQECLDLVRGALSYLDSDQMTKLFTQLLKKIDKEEHLVNLLLLFPTRKSTWNLLNLLSEKANVQYWKKITSFSYLETNEECYECVINLIKVKRPDAAFQAIEYQLEEVEPKLLLLILSALSKERSRNPKELFSENCDITTAMKLVAADLSIPLSQRAELEFQLIQDLTRLPRWQPESQLPCLDQLVRARPEIFVEAIVKTFLRKNGGEDPLEIKGMRRSPYFTEQYFLLLEHLHGVNEAELNKKKTMTLCN